MATFEKRENGWRAQVCKNGIRVSKVLSTKSEARMWAAEKEVEISNGGVLKPSMRTLCDLLVKYETEVTPHKKSAKKELVRITYIKRSKLAKIRLDDLSASDLARWRDERLLTVKGSSVNRDLNLLSAAFNRAIAEWGWMKVNLVSQIKRPKNPNPRDVRISEAEIERVLVGLKFDGAILNKSHRVAASFLFALETGMRLGEICALSAMDVQEHFVLLRASKNGDARQVPLSRRAKELAALIVNSGVTVSASTASALFMQMARQQGLQFTFHDSRHEALTRLAKKLSVLDLARMVGHRDVRSLMIYYNPTMGELSAQLD